MTCNYCNSNQMVEGSLVGVSFEPSSESKKLFAGGIYDIKASVCLACGAFTSFRLDTAALKKLIKDKK